MAGDIVSFGLLGFLAAMLSVVVYMGLCGPRGDNTPSKQSGKAWALTSIIAGCAGVAIAILKHL